MLCQHSFSVVLVSFKHLFFDVRLFHYIVIEHILECLVWWHFVSYVGYYLRLGHTPILEFIRSFVDFLTTRSFSWSLQVVILGHTLSSTLLLGHTLILEFIKSFANFLITWSISWSLQVVILGHTPILEFIRSFADFSLLNLFLGLYKLSYWGMPSLTLFYWGIPPSLSSSNLLQFFSLLDLFLNLCESSCWAIPPLALFYWDIPPLWVYHISCWFHDC